jgi:N-acetylglucosamine malate deacetylase 1
MKRILVLSPHTDDGEWGAGGTIAKWVERGSEVIYIAFSTCVQSLPNGLADNTLELECKNATKTLGIKETRFLDYDVRYFNYRRQDILEDLVKVNKELKPDIVLLPNQNDIHQDHHTIYAEGVRAFKNSNLLGYELIWNNITSTTTYFTKLEEAHLQKKIDSVMCYHSQEFRNYHNEEFIKSLAMTRGVQANSKYAEAFDLIKWVD